MTREELLRQFEAAVRKRTGRRAITYSLKHEHGMTDVQLWAFQKDIKKEMKESCS